MLIDSLLFNLSINDMFFFYALASLYDSADNLQKFTQYLWMVCYGSTNFLCVFRGDVLLFPNEYLYKCTFTQAWLWGYFRTVFSVIIAELLFCFWAILCSCSKTAVCMTSEEWMSSKLVVFIQVKLMGLWFYIWNLFYVLLYGFFLLKNY